MNEATQTAADNLKAAIRKQDEAKAAAQQNYDQAVALESNRRTADDEVKAAEQALLDAVSAESKEVAE